MVQGKASCRQTDLWDRRVLDRTAAEGRGTGDQWGKEGSQCLVLATQVIQMGKVNKCILTLSDTHTHTHTHTISDGLKA